ncbi:hypothetical protein [uncultured Chitinophaga sp.]|jgi:hypothetical protein|uniref:hypothetical protein n=1 Tax=uncultured Chitinophaga sp. TaxID=339340 RepID=UPI002622A54F|nr:hypothetical protein [uncultured Chitinophaga sp.]
MKRTALITLVMGALVALLSYAAGEAGLLSVKAYFQIGITGVGLMILSAGYFLTSFMVEWARETDLFRRIL